MLPRWRHCKDAARHPRQHVPLPPHPAGQQRSLTGLEGTAAGGAGSGIEAFKRQAPRRQQQPATGSAAAFQLGSAKLGLGGGPAIDADALPASQFTELRLWSAAQLAAALAPAPGSGGSGGNALSNLLTQTYAKYQGAAGRSVGITPGEAWRVALRAAVANGASQASWGRMGRWARAPRTT